MTGYRPTLVRRLSQAMASALARSFWRLEVKGLENVPREGPLIVASNHVSVCDGPMLTIALGQGRCLRFLAKTELFRVPLLGWWLEEVGNIPVDRGRGDVPAMRAAVEMVRRGGCLGVFPEGTRGVGGATPGRRPGQPRAVKPGVGFLARETGARVVPARLVNTDRFPAPHRIEVRFGEPMKFEGDAGDRSACQDFAHALMERINTL
ncbi:MAG: 1-acyl-sn-glycerol-3-phosphate acyltransferase [Elusimicrobia bacterium]|nr:1-acyl-sn-glycerol-3-phosphate acyltransferase [Elusimicrobiota bacterium]